MPLAITLPIFAFSVLSSLAGPRAQGQARTGNFGWVLRPAPAVSQQESEFSRSQDDERRGATDQAREEQRNKDEEKCLAQFQPNDNPPPLHRAAANGSVQDVLQEIAAVFSF